MAKVASRLTGRAKWGFAGDLAGACRWAIIAYLTMLLGGLLTCEARAQDSLLPDQRKNADVQALLANDEKVVQLKQQLSARELSNVEYSQQVAELTKKRTEILRGYDRAGQRELLSLYNAAKKDQALAARQAAALAAQEKKEAAAQAAAMEAKTKADALQAEKAAQNRVMEADAQAYIQLVLQHDALVIQEDIRGVSEAERMRMTELSTRGEQVKKKYAKEGPLFAQTNLFGQRITQLEKELVAPAVPSWVSDVFPEPEAVVAAYDNDVQRAAGLRVVARMLRDRVKPPWPETVNQKLARYQTALEKIDPPSGGEKHFTLAKTYGPLGEDPHFRIEVVKKFFVSAYGRQQVQLAQGEIRQKEASAQSNKINRWMNLTLAGLIGLPLLYLARGQRPRQRATEKARNPFRPPEAMQWISVFRKKYRLDFDCGRIYEKDVWTETSSTTTTSGGNTVNQGGVLVTMPQTTTTKITTTVYHQYWFRTPDGRESWSRFSDKVFMASKGQIISTISFGTHVVMAYNHATSDLVLLKTELRVANRFTVIWLFLASMALGTAALFAMRAAVGADYISPDGHPWAHLLQAGILIMAGWSGAFLLLLKLVLHFIRTSQFRRRYEPVFRHFLEESTPKLAEHYGEAYFEKAE